jgi:hypothetical protein
MVVEAGSVFKVHLDDALWATVVEETAFPHFLYKVTVLYV